MDAPTMTRRVADAAGVERARAVQALEGAMRVLAQRINGNEAEDLAAQLPPEIGGGLLEQATLSREPERFGHGEFVRRFGAQVSADDDEAEHLLTAVFDVIGHAVEPGEWGDVLAQLPNDMDPLFTDDRPSAHTH